MNVDRSGPTSGASRLADRPPMTQRFAEAAAFQRKRAPFSASLSDVFAGRPHLAELLSHAPDEQRLPVLVLAAVRDSVLAEPDCPLAAWYPDLCDQPRTDDVAEALDAHVTDRWDALVHTVTTRATQTNEVGRCGLLLTAIAQLDEPEIGLVDVGTSAGLNLWFDHYRYEYRDETGTTTTVGPDSAVVLPIELAGAVSVPSTVPVVRARIGIDTAPVSLADERSVRWLKACIWPDQRDRIERFDAAVRIARRGSVDLRRVDAVDGIVEAVDDAAAHAHPVVMHSWVLNYLPAERRQAFVDALDEIGRRRELSWVFAEGLAATPELPHPAEIADSALTAVTAVTWRSGHRTVRNLGVAHPHGYWLRDPATEPRTG